MATILKFEDLEIWQMARSLCQKIYPLTFEDPIAKDFRYKDQIRGSCGSIMDNIAEVFGRGSKLEFINSLTIAKGEAEELKSQLYRALDNIYISKTLFEDLYSETELLIKKIGAFISYLNKSNIRRPKVQRKNLTPKQLQTPNPKLQTSRLLPIQLQPVWIRIICRPE